MDRGVILRVARPSDDLDALLPFYVDGVGLSLLSRFQDHRGFDGVMLGGAGAPYHLEFTHARGHRAGRAPTQDNLLVFYLPEMEAWRAAVAGMRAAGFDPTPAFNPYWDEAGVTFEDPDGYRVVFQQAAWPGNAGPVELQDPVGSSNPASAAAGERAML